MSGTKLQQNASGATTPFPMEQMLYTATTAIALTITFGARLYKYGLAPQRSPLTTVYSIHRSTLRYLFYPFAFLYVDPRQ